MATPLLFGGSRLTHRQRTCPSGHSLLELLVVFFIMGAMLCLLLPALRSAHASAQAKACQNNVRQLDMGLSGYLSAKRRFPVPNRWTVDMLKWTEETALADAMKDNFDPNANFPRPPLLRCPMQEDFSSRVPGVGLSHYLLVVDRPILCQGDRVHWEIQDRERLEDTAPQEPWYLAPEISFAKQQILFATLPGPHPSDVYMNANGSIEH